ncbi:hypothetical protein AB8810_11025 [Xanthomonas sp. NCPPB 3005]|uniref:hypothetical protein n=1 Tax=Xanthomonas sp. NCPPB 3005 TaxID=3240913 RepID=UPI00351858CC
MSVKRNRGPFSAAAVRAWMLEHATEGKTYAQIYVEMGAVELEDRSRIRDAVRYMLAAQVAAKVPGTDLIAVTGKEMPRQAKMMTPEQARAREAELRRARHVAAGGVSREQYLEQLAAGKIVRRPQPRKPRVQPRLVRVGARAANTPVPKKQLAASRAESVEQFMARGGQVMRLPGFEGVRPVWNR